LVLDWPLFTFRNSFKVRFYNKDMKFEYFEHTADVMFKAYGKTLEKAFENSALATFHVMTDTEKVKAVLNKSISVKGHDLKALLYNFLEELLFLLDTEFFLLSKVKGLKIDKIGKEYVLSTLVSGDLAASYSTHGDVKAITYNEMEIKETTGGCTIQVVLDI
jgi:SHS2 domain-containing protein